VGKQQNTIASPVGAAQQRRGRELASEGGTPSRLPARCRRYKISRT